MDCREIMRLFCVLILFTLIPKESVGQETEESEDVNAFKVLGLKLHQGVVLIHSRELRPIKNSYPTGVELDLAWHKTTQKSWESCLCYPKLGASITYWDYDNKEVLGQGITGMFYLEPVFGAAKKLSFSIRAAFGLSYQNRPYDEVENPDNLSYSTYVAFPLQLGGSGHFRLNQNFLLDLSVLYNHFSNGGIREPNKGINWPSVALGVEYYLQTPEFYNRPRTNWRENDTPQKRLDFNFFLAFEEPRSKLYLLSPGLEIKWSKQFARINAFTLGGEILYDNGTRYIIEQNQENESPVKGSLAVGHEFLLGRFLFSQQIGFYLYKPYSIHSDLYQRYGLVYRISDRFSAGINLKAHGHVANFLDFRVGFSL